MRILRAYCRWGYPSCVSDDLAMQAHQTLLDSFVDYAERAGGVHEIRDGVMLCVGAHPEGYAVNAALPTTDGVDPEVFLHTVERFFRASPGFRYEIWTRAGRDDELGLAASAAGLERGSDEPTLVATEPPPERGVVRRLTPDDGLDDFLEVLADAFADEKVEDVPDMLRASFAMPERWLQDDVAIAVAYDGGTEPLAAGLVQHLGDGGYIPWVGTKGKARRRGVGGAVTADLTRWVFDQGATLCSLQTSPAGMGAYRAVGYQESGLVYRTYWGRSPASA